MSYQTTAGLPTEGDTFTKLMDALRTAQDCAALLSHLTGLNGAAGTSYGWLQISERLKLTQQVVTSIAIGKMQ